MGKALNPILERHLQRTARSNLVFWLLGLYLLAVLLLTLLVSGLPFIATWEATRGYSMSDIHQAGRLLFHFSSFLLLLALLVLTPINALGSLAAEHEGRTLELLRLTTLSARSIVWGKLGAALAGSSLYLLAPIPLLLLGFWLGGVGYNELLVTLFFLLVTLLATSTLALFISSLVRKTIAAVLLYYGLQIAALPVLGLVILLFQGLNSWINYGGGGDLPRALRAALLHGWVGLAALHPLTAGVISQVLWYDQDSWLLLDFNVPPSTGTTIHGVTTLTLPSPWIPYTLLVLGFSAFLLWRTARRLERPER